MSGSIRLQNSDVLANLGEKLQHLPRLEQKQLSALILEFADLFPNTPRRTTLVHHDVDVGDAHPIKQHPYRLNPVKLEAMKKEVEYMLTHDIIEPSRSYRFCTDFRKINAITKSDSYPIPRVEDCIDKIGDSKYVSKFDLLKGYWQVPLTGRARKISEFVTPTGFYQYKVMPFGMKNAPATFQRMIHKVIANLEGCEEYIDDIIVYGSTWEQHLQRVKDFPSRLREAQLTVNLVKSEFGQARVTYLGYIVDQGQIKPVEAKVNAINFPVPNNRSQLMRFLGMVGHYRKFCKNFTVIAEPLTCLLQKRQMFCWTEEQQEAFTRIKTLLVTAAVLTMPDFQKPFIIYVDASELGVGAVLMQEDDNKLEHPIVYFSRKFNNSQRNYCTSEKEALALILAL